MYGNEKKFVIIVDTNNDEELGGGFKKNVVTLQYVN